jgi:hypothetical protein
MLTFSLQALSVNAYTLNMTTLEAVPVSLPQHIVLDYISWGTYQSLLEDLGEKPIQLT